MKIYDLSQDLNQDCSFWPYYPPFEVKYIKRKSEHGVTRSTSRLPITWEPIWTRRGTL